ncbi:MAG TPA: hypothetical protein VNQ79_06755 [Blastocatellia bacterium]|nr:hypothetical protein [Blastocatellia bacterium]
MTFAERITELEMDIDFAVQAMEQAGPAEQPYYEHAISLLRAQRDELQGKAAAVTLPEPSPAPEAEDQEREEPMPTMNLKERDNYKDNLERRIVSGEPIPKSAKYQLGVERFNAAMQARAANGWDTNGLIRPKKAKLPVPAQEPAQPEMPEEPKQPQTPTVITISGEPSSDLAIDLQIKRSGETIIISGSSLLALRLAQTALNGLGAEI